MMSEAQTTRTLAQIAGPFLTLIGAALALRPGVVGELITDWSARPVSVFGLGLFTLLTGLVGMVLHHRWRTPLQIFLSVLGVLLIVRGCVLLLFPSPVMGLVNHANAALPLSWIAGLLAIVLGLWITYQGFINNPAYARKPRS